MHHAKASDFTKPCKSQVETWPKRLWSLKENPSTLAKDHAGHGIMGPGRISYLSSASNRWSLRTAANQPLTAARQRSVLGVFTSENIGVKRHAFGCWQSHKKVSPIQAPLIHSIFTRNRKTSSRSLTLAIDNSPLLSLSTQLIIAKHHWVYSCNPPCQRRGTASACAGFPCTKRGPRFQSQGQVQGENANSGMLRQESWWMVMVHHGDHNGSILPQS